MAVLLEISEQLVNEDISLDADIFELFLSHGSKKIAFPHKADTACFELRIENATCRFTTNYFVGLDWVVPGIAAVNVDSKLSDKAQVDIFGMLLESLEDPENLQHLDDLYHIDFDEPYIVIRDQKTDKLSPLLVVQFLKLVQAIVRKGLKKAYYRVTENLESRIKGRILVGRQIKENIAKNRMTRTICNYQEYGLNTRENQFLKLVLTFVSSYLAQRQHLFTQAQTRHLRHILDYCLPAFERIDLPSVKHQSFHVVKNPFYREYEKAIEIGQYILKRFSFNINKISETETSSPPFWIDMSKLFELYVFGKLRKIFPQIGDVTYHDKYRGGKETDFLIRAEHYKCVIDCKYKPKYNDGPPSLEDKRQLAGYTRLKSVYRKLKIDEGQIVPGLIIFSHQDCLDHIDKASIFSTEIGEHVQFYKLGIRLPEL